MMDYEECEWTFYDEGTQAICPDGQAVNGFCGANKKGTTIYKMKTKCTLKSVDQKWKKRTFLATCPGQNNGGGSHGINCCKPLKWKKKHNLWVINYDSYSMTHKLWAVKYNKNIFGFIFDYYEF